MIHVLTTAHHTYPVGDYLKSWCGPSHPQIKVLTYENLPSILPRSTYIFADLERLSRTQLALAAEAWDQLAASGEGIRLLNHPLRVLRRFALLRKLVELEINRYSVFRATDSMNALLFPVFVRRADEHEGSFSGLLRNHAEVDQAIVRLLLAGASVENILVVEFCDTATNGVFRKYSAFRVGDQIVPRHLIFSEKWVLKVPDLIDASKAEEEQAYLTSNPHEAELRAIFDTARIEYGRIDYGILDGRIQVWEINTNPLVMMARDKYSRLHLPAQEFFAGRIRLAFDSIDAKGPAQPMVALSLLDCARRLRDSGIGLPPNARPEGTR